jgi:hypothetical protein
VGEVEIMGREQEKKKPETMKERRMKWMTEKGTGRRSVGRGMGRARAYPWRGIVRTGVLAAGFAVLAHGSLGGQAAVPFDHSLFDGLLRAHVYGEGLVDCDAFGRSREFQEYLAGLARAPVQRLPEAERLALWINAYNAYTIELINRHEERSSIRNINRALGFIRGKGPWKERMAEVGGETWTLDEIEHEIIRPEFGEPRIHFALVCAAMGCPPLRNEACTGKDLERQLEDQARVLLAESPGKNRVDVESGRVYLSPIFDWYREDFPPGDEGLGAYLAQYMPGDAEKTLLTSGRFRVVFTDSDWSLNVAPGQPSPES